MFTDGPSPFRPRPHPNVGVLVIGGMLAGVLGSWLFLDWKQAHDAAARRVAARATVAASSARSRSTPGSEPRYRATTPDALVAPSLPLATARTVSPPATAAAPTTIYLCTSYSGGSFWSNASCHTQRATVDRMTTVPGDLPFDRQVAIASRLAEEADLPYHSPPPPGAGRVGPSSPGSSPGSSRYAECTAIDEAVRLNDATARQPQSASMQDWLRQGRMRLQAQRAAMSC